MQHRIVRPLAVIAFGGAMALGLSAGALATEDPVDLDGAVFVDRTGQYASDAADITSHLEAHNAASDADVYAVVVESYDGASRQAWSIESAERSGLGQDALLLTIAMRDGQWGYAIANAYPVSESAVNAAGQGALVPALNNGDVAGGIMAFADAIGEAEAGGQGGAGGTPGTQVNVDEGAVWPVVALVGGAAVVGGGAWAISRGVRANRKRQQQREVTKQQQLTLEELKQRADIALVQLDDTVQQSEQELAFANAQFGADAVRPYREALDRAKGGLAEAFGLQQQLDDAFPDTDQERHEWSSRILQIADGAGRELASHAQSFGELRDLEHNAPQALENVAALREQLGQRIGATQAILERLERDHAGSSVDPLRENIAGASRLVPTIDESLRHGQEAVRAGDGSKAALAVRAAEAALGQASGLLAGVERAEGDLQTASRQLAELVEDSVGDIATARSLPRGATDLEPLIGHVEQNVQAARQHPVDTLAVLATLQRANQRLDEATGQVREEGDRRRRAEGELQRWLTSARSNIDMAEQYVQSRRIGVGTRARQHLAAAQQELAQALRLERQDPQQALSHAQRASAYAQQALEEAQDDVGHWGDDGWGPRNPYYRGGGRGSDMLTGGLLGYILGDMMSGGRHGGGYGGGVSDPFAGGQGGGGGGLGDLFSGGGGSFGGGGGGFFGGGFGGFGGGGGFSGGGGSFGN